MEGQEVVVLLRDVLVERVVQQKLLAQEGPASLQTEKSLREAGIQIRVQSKPSFRRSTEMKGTE